MPYLFKIEAILTNPKIESVEPRANSNPTSLVLKYASKKLELIYAVNAKFIENTKLALYMILRGFFCMILL